jgi:hypothetical protein
MSTETITNNFFDILSTGNLDALKMHLNQSHEFDIFKSKKLFLFSSVSQIYLDGLASNLLIEASHTSPSVVSENIKKFLDSDEIAGFEILAINGIKINKEFEIVPGIKLVPFDQLPDSDIKAQYDYHAISKDFISVYPDELFHKRTPTFLTSMTNYQQLKPTAALIIETSFRKFIDDKDVEKISLFNVEKLRDICLFLTLSTKDSAPFEVSYWWQPKDYWIARVFKYVGASVFHFEGYKLTCIPSENEINRIANFYEKFLKLNESEKGKLKITIKRINLSRRNHNIVDKAIDIGIAMELFFLSEEGNKNDLSFRLCLRAAWLLRPSVEDRKKIFELFKKIYDFRSQAVHQGIIKKDKEASQLIDEGINYLVEAIFHVIDNGFRDWNTLVLGTLIHKKPTVIFER